MKKLLCWLLAMALVLSAAGCKKKQDTETAATEAPTPQATEAEVLEVPYEQEADSRPYVGVTLNFQSVLEASAPEAAAVVQAAKYFETTTGAKVNILWQEGMVDVSQADIFEVTGALLASDYLDYALDLGDMAQAAGYENWSHAAIRQQVTDRCGYLAGIASVPHLTAVYYDVDAFESCGIETVPGSWADFLTLCKVFALKGWMPLTMDADFAYMATELHLERALGTGALRTLTSGWAKTEEAVFAAEQVSYLVAASYVAAPGVYPEGFQRLAGSNAVMIASSDRLCQKMEQDGMMEVRWGVFPWPGDGAGTGTAVDEQVMAINKNTKNPQAAFDFIQLLTSGEFDQLRADLRRGIPADPNNTSVIEGAVEAMKKASSESFGLLDTAYNEVYAQLWRGAYPTGDAFLGALRALG